MQQREDGRTKYEAEQLERNCRVHGGNVLPRAFIEVLVREMLALRRAGSERENRTVQLEQPVMRIAS
jgi:hypothetical protein